jgi:hypothetical protein
MVLDNVDRKLKICRNSMLMEELFLPLVPSYHMSVVSNFIGRATMLSDVEVRHTGCPGTHKHVPSSEQPRL